MKSVITFFLVLVSMASHAQLSRKVTIIHTNDLHSRITGYSPESDYSPLSVNNDKTVGGFARIATLIKDNTSNNEGVSLVLDAGDFLMGTLFQGLEAETGFQLRLMKLMGYDAVAIGNHEFDFGPAKLASIVNAASRNGEYPEILLGNAVFDRKNPDDDSLQILFDNGIIARTTVLTKGGLKTGLFSLMGKVADENAAFAPPVTFSDQVKTARKLVRILKNEGCDLIICLSHSGLEYGSDGFWEGEDADLAEKVEGIDVIISGHTHSLLTEPLIIKGTIIVQAGEYGKNVGRLDLVIENGAVRLDKYSLISVNDVVNGDPAIHSLIENQKKLVSGKILAGIGLDYGTQVSEASFPLECNEQGNFEESNLGPLVADAIRQYVNRHTPEGTDMSMVAVGVIRDNIVPGIQSPPDIFRIMSMGTGNDAVPGYPLATLYVTGKELKNILEILQVAYKSTPGNYCFYSGIKAEIDVSKGLLRKIQKLEIVNDEGINETVDFSSKNRKLYSITANSYMLQFIGIIKKMSFGLINVVPKDKDGNPIKEMSTAVIDIDAGKQGVQEGKEWLAILEFLSRMPDANNNGIPDVDPKYKVPVKSISIIGGK